MARDEEVTRELAELRQEVQRLREAVSGLTRTRREDGVPGRIRTFVEGFDAALGGGIPRGSVVILAGPSGSMKTSLTLSMVAHNLREGLRSLYISLEEGRESMLRTMEQLGLPKEDDFIVDIAKMRIEHENVEDTRDWLTIMKDYLSRRLEKGEIDLVVIDPLNALYSLAEMGNPRQDLFHFITYLRSLHVTTVLIAETEGAQDFPNREEFLADGAITLSYANETDGHVDLRIRCVKMRHANHSRDFFRLEFEDGQFRARPMGAA